MTKPDPSEITASMSTFKTSGHFLPISVDEQGATVPSITIGKETENQGSDRSEQERQSDGQGDIADGSAKVWSESCGREGYGEETDLSWACLDKHSLTRWRQ